MSGKKTQLSQVKNVIIFLVLSGVVISSCDRIKQKSKAAINKSGETIGKGSSEFFNGVAAGIDQTFQCKINLSESLSGKGLTFGKFYIVSDSAGTENKLSLYLIFNKDFKQTLTVKVLDQKGAEYGRTQLPLEGKSGEARYYDIVFDKRTDIESKSSFVIEE